MQRRIDMIRSELTNLAVQNALGPSSLYLIVAESMHSLSSCLSVLRSRID